MASKSKRYTADGWVDCARVYDNGRPFCILVGGRQIGKTYGMVRELMLRDDFFLFLRRTEDELESIQDPKLDPFQKPARELGMEHPWKMFRINKHVFQICPADYDAEKSKWTPAGPPVGLAAAVSTYAKVRGFSADMVKTILYDEFIPERHIHKFRNEGDALLNIYESVNSNRELEGRPPVKLICLANSNNIANPVMMSFGIVERADRLEQNGQHSFTTPDLYYCNYDDSPKSAQKADTALYRVTRGTGFQQMALLSKFQGSERGNIKPQDLREYKPVVVVGEIEFYQHKAEPKLYCTMHKSGTVPRFQTGPINYTRFRRRFPGIIDAYFENRILFETFTCEMYLREVLGLT